MDNITLLSFIEENYIWILIIIVVILMTAIGYIADKTNFISKNKKDKKKNNEQEEKLYTKKDIEEILKQKEIIDNDFKQNYENKTDVEETIDLEEIKKENNDENKEDLYVGLDGTPNVFSQEEPTIDIELPDIDELKQDNYEDESEDEMWKF